MRAGLGKRWEIEVTGETRHYGTPDQEGSLHQEDQNLPAKNPTFHLGSKEAAILKMLKETRGETCSLLRERQAEVSKPLTEEEEEVMREVEDEAEGRESRRCTGERGSSRPAGQLAGRRGTGVKAKRAEARTPPR